MCTLVQYCISSAATNQQLLDKYISVEQTISATTTKIEEMKTHEKTTYVEPALGCWHYCISWSLYDRLTL